MGYQNWNKKARYYTEYLVKLGCKSSKEECFSARKRMVWLLQEKTMIRWILRKSVFREGYTHWHRNITEFSRKINWNWESETTEHASLENCTAPSLTWLRHSGTVMDWQWESSRHVNLKEITRFLEQQRVLTLAPGKFSRKRRSSFCTSLDCKRLQPLLPMEETFQRN